jgi:thiol-disulfide isomerase/thioredoxin
MNIHPLARFGLAVSLLFGGLEATAAEPRVLSPGAKAPRLSAQHWFQNGRDNSAPVTDFDAGKIYLVEFWATSCSHCIQSMPDLAKLQKRWGTERLQVIGVSSEPLEIVDRFLNRSVSTEGGRLIAQRDVVAEYRLASDPDGSTEMDYMVAAKRSIIPTVFVVDAEGSIAWIGHPKDVDDVVARLMEGRWNSETYSREKAAIAEIQSKLSRLVAEKRYQEAITTIDSYLKQPQESRVRFGLQKLKVEIQVNRGTSRDESPEVLESLLREFENEPLYVQDIAWTAYEMVNAKQIRQGTVIATSIAALEKSLKMLGDGGAKANMYDTMAHLCENAGQRDRAIQYQKEALRMANDDQRDLFRSYLQELDVPQG